ncbi:hypothetical protein QCA50_015336 [Cerrena zonata]|uniref:POP1-domain-containing protein n=1 Tax=Cerrena zonata TaxID=2478898 RepID=A0AAW0FVJ8_9APHY
MAPKRKGDEQQAQHLTGKDKKKQKLASARTIPVQTPSAVAGPSKTVRFDGAKPLPGSLDVERFAEARAFEINAMHTAMSSARDNATHRAWQQLPRHLRRRAASHDVRRVPVRLREKARAEMDPVKHKKKNLPKRGKAKRISRTETFLKRQQDKTWLETHLWHAKRMHMDNIWGYRLAVQPTEKSFRPSHRAAVHGSILHDASYHGIIELKGPEDILRMILESCCDASAPSPGAKRFVNGTRACDIHFYKRGAYPLDLIAPVTVIWQPVNGPAKGPSGSENSSGGVEAEGAGPSTGRKRKGKSQQKASPSTIDISPPTRLLWIKVHPSIFHEVYIELRDAASFALETVKKSSQSDEPELTVEIADLRTKLNIFEIMGPKSSQIIRGVLRPVLDDKREELKKFWHALGDLQTTASLPRNMIIGMKVHDPRLTFPPNNAKVHVDINSASPSLSTASLFPTSILAQSEIWDETIRDPLMNPRYKKKDLDDRRSKNAIPGTPLQATQKDDRIPILLIQRSLEPLSTESSHSPGLHGWTVILPAGWSMPFFSSLIHTGTRVGGQRERAAQHFEASHPNFPTDYPTTEAYEDYAEKREEEERSRWERKPPAKRVNYPKLGIRSPWRADWEVVLGLTTPDEQNENGDNAMDESEDLVPAQREALDLQAISNATSLVETEKQHDNEFPDSNQPRPWLLQGSAVVPALDAAASTLIRSTGLVHYFNSQRAKRGLESLDFSHKAEDIWKTALVMVKLRMCGRGKPDDLAVLYRLTDEEWRKAMLVAQKPSDMNLDDEDEEGRPSDVIPPEESIIGYVTAGNFSLSVGEGHAIGCLPVSELFDIKEQAKRLGQGSSMLVNMRNRDGLICRPAYLDVLDC